MQPYLASAIALSAPLARFVRDLLSVRLLP